MEEIRLQKPYLSVEIDNHHSFGGSQRLFKTDAEGSKVSKIKAQCGCGVVAFADLLWYLNLSDEEFQEKKFFSEAEYKDYFNHVTRKLGGIPPRLGISLVQPFVAFNCIAKRKKSDLRAIWGLSIEKLFPRMEEMLREDIPVYMCFPTTYFKKKGTDGIWLYKRRSDGSFEKVTRTSSHYVIATEMIKIAGISWIGVSSWGEKYYFKEQEYKELLKRTFLGNYTGNLLYVRTSPST